MLQAKELKIRLTNYDKTIAMHTNSQLLQILLPKDEKKQKVSVIICKNQKRCDFVGKITKIFLHS